MNVLDPVKSIMTTKLITVSTGDKLTVVKEIFDNNRIHHVPVVRYKELVGIISKTDFMHFLRGFNRVQTVDYTGSEPVLLINGESLAISRVTRISG